LLGALVVAGVIGASSAVRAQTATFYGSLGNFDVVNNTGEDACGFRLDFPGVASTAQFGAFSANRYGAPAIGPYDDGVSSGMRVEYRSSDCATNKTVPHAPGTAFLGTCYQWNTTTYPTSGCEHYGVYASTNIPTPVAHWLVNDPATPGGVIPFASPIAVPQPYYYVVPPVQPNDPPVVAAVVEAPEPAEAPELYGDAQWIKVFVRQLPREVNINELVTDNPLVVPMDPGQLEVNWDVIQAEPASNSNGNRRRSRKQGNSTLDPTTRSIVRRYEVYAYTGAYDPVTHEALCADLTCSAPGADELGDFISAQMTALNVQGDFITVAKSGTGGGNVESTDKRIACGSKCASAYPAGTQVTLSAKANSGSTFVGWTGACAGTGSCTVSVAGSMTVGAQFDTVTSSGGGGGGGSGGGSTGTTALLKISIGATGTVTSDPAGINCGSACQASYPKGTAVTLTATPPAGKTFASWSGACSGTATTCTVTMNADASVKALFNK
jgi:hypothetical protein